MLGYKILTFEKNSTWSNYKFENGANFKCFKAYMTGIWPKTIKII